MLVEQSVYVNRCCLVRNYHIGREMDSSDVLLQRHCLEDRKVDEVDSKSR